MSVAAGLDYIEIPRLIKYFDLIDESAWKTLDEYVGGKMTQEFSKSLYVELENRSFWVKGCIDSTREVVNNGIALSYSTKNDMVDSIYVSKDSRSLFSAYLK